MIFQLFMHIASELFKLVVGFIDQRIVLVPRNQRNKNDKGFFFVWVFFVCFGFYFEHAIFLNVEIPPTLLNFV